MHGSRPNLLRVCQQRCQFALRRSLTRVPPVLMHIRYNLVTFHTVTSSSGENGDILTTTNKTQIVRVTWGMTAPGGKTVPPTCRQFEATPHIYRIYRMVLYHLPDTCFERRASGIRRNLRYSIINIYSCSDVIFSHNYTCHSSLYISDNKNVILYHANT